MRILVVTLTLFFLSFEAFAADQAGYSINAAVFHSTQKYDFTDIGGGTGKGTQLNYDLGFGYTMASGLYFGGIYGVVGEDDGTNDVSDNYLGVSIGYRSSGWQLTAHYFLSAEDEQSATSQLTGGSGIGIDLAYLWSINTTFAIGPQLTYRNLKYTKYETGGSETTVDVTNSYSLPYIVFALNF
ncbi:MAG: hypothetical protein IPJ71_00435 [Bdellovibrionales bacterium]|nr:hypothetical protein [Bdellovibrionales bacterium]